MKESIFQTKSVLNLSGKIFSIDQPLVMGILNVTPDSFYDGGLHHGKENIITQAAKMLEEGADMIDVGGYSSRPGAINVPEEEELTRVITAIQWILNQFPEAIISVDTFRSGVARAAINAGAKIINDISGGEADPEMYNIIAEYKAPYILMHMRGKPETMHQFTKYDHLIADIIDYFAKKVKNLHKLGVSDIILDPGFGFAKTIAQNYELLRNLNYFNILNCPILIGISRKSMIYKKLDCLPGQALNGTTVLHTIALTQGAKILRAHDVKEAKEAVKLYLEVYK